MPPENVRMQMEAGYPDVQERAAGSGCLSLCLSGFCEGGTCGWLFSSVSMTASKDVADNGEEAA